jgi:hypothetical protein
MDAPGGQQVQMTALVCQYREVLAMEHGLSHGTVGILMAAAQHL